MSKPKFAMQTRIIKVYHPLYKDILLFEAVVRVINLNTKMVKSITKVNIEYELNDVKLD